MKFRKRDMNFNILKVSNGNLKATPSVLIVYTSGVNQKFVLAVHKLFKSNSTMS